MAANTCSFRTPTHLGKRNFELRKLIQLEPKATVKDAEVAESGTRMFDGVAK
jgi:hypothetical protein